MPAITTSDAKQTAKELGIPWDLVEETAERIAEGDPRQRAADVRRAAWEYATGSTPGCWPFWRHGFASRWGVRYERHGYEVIPGHDELLDYIARRFGEYDCPTGGDDLFAFLMSDYEPLPRRGELLDAALDELLAIGTRAGEWTTTTDEVPF